MHQSFETPVPPPPPFGHERGKAGTFTYDSLQFGPPLGGECARNHGLGILDRGISGAVTPWSAICIFSLHSNYIDSLDQSDHSVIIEAK